MTIKTTTILIVSFLFSNLIYSQSKIERGKYISSDRLQYIIIYDNSEFEYISYLGESPYTYNEKRKKEKKSRFCGTVGFVSNGSGKGNYEIRRDSLILKFNETANVYMLNATKKKGVKKYLISNLKFSSSK